MKKTLVLLTIIAFIAASCVSFKGDIPTNTIPGRNDSVHYVDIAYGYSKSVNFFGIGGTKQAGLYLDAKRNLLLNELKPGQFFDNITSDRRSTWVGPYHKTEVLISADIAESRNKSAFLTSDNYRKRIGLDTTSFFKPGDSVKAVGFGRVIGGKVIRYEQERVTIAFVDIKTHTLRMKTFSYDMVGRFSGVDAILSKLKFRIGQDVVFPSGANLINGTVVAVNKTHAILTSRIGVRTVVLSLIRTK